MDLMEYRERRKKWRLSAEGKVMPAWLVIAGVVGELGEVVDLIKKEQWHGKDITGKMILELGDVLWYLDELAIQHFDNQPGVHSRVLKAFSHEDCVNAVLEANAHLYSFYYGYDVAYRAVQRIAGFYKLEISDILQANVDKLEERYPNGFVLGGGIR